MANDGTTKDRFTAREVGILIALAGIQFTHMVDFMLLMPLGPRYIREMSLSTRDFGLLVSVYGFSAALAGLAAARLIDRFDRRAVLLVLYTGFAVATLACGLVTSYPALLAARCAAGAFGGVTASVVLAVVGDMFAFERRGRAMGTVMSSFPLALIAGVPFGIYLSELGDRGTPFAILAGAAAGVLGLIWGLIPPLRGHLHSHAGERTSLLDGLRRPDFIRAYLLVIALVLSTFTVIPYIATYTVFNLGMPEEMIKYVYLCSGAATLVSMNLIGRWSDRYGKLRVFRVLAVLSMAGMLVQTNLPPVPLFWIIMVSVVLTVTTSGRMVPAQSIITACALPRERGLFLSIHSAVQSTASGLAVLLAGSILGDAEQRGPLAHFGAVGLISVAFGAASIVLVSRLRPAVAPETLPALATEAVA